MKDDIALPEPSLSTGAQLMKKHDMLTSAISKSTHDIIGFNHEERKYVYTCKEEDSLFLDTLHGKINAKEMEIVGYNKKLHDLSPLFLDLLNTFPLNRPCTTIIIGKELGLPQKIVECTLFRKSEISYKHLNSDYDDAEEAFLLKDEPIIIESTIIYPIIISIYNTVCYPVCKMIYPNWQFVASKKVTYLERIA